jgi:AcrR family transcriptional regulator
MFNNEKIDLRVKYTREWTFEAIFKLLEHKKYDEINISEIINKAGISRATFYRNFSTKDDVIKFKVEDFFHQFFMDMKVYYDVNKPSNERDLIGAFFEKVDESNKLIDVVIAVKLEYLMVNGILQLITYFKDHFYQIEANGEKQEEYTMEIVASSAWTLLSRWHRSGKKESAKSLAKIYMEAFKLIASALYQERNVK